MDTMGGAIAENQVDISERCATDAGEAAHRWYVVATKRHREQVAGAFLAQLGIHAYVPRMLQSPPPAVGSAVGPLFPGYLFVWTDLAAHHYRISLTPGVKCFVGFGAGPAVLDPAVIEFLRAREGPDRLIRCGQTLSANCEVEIINGPFRGLMAVVQEPLRAHERVRVLIDILRRATPVELPVNWVRRAS